MVGGRIVPGRGRARTPIFQRPVLGIRCDTAFAVAHLPANLITGNAADHSRARRRHNAALSFGWLSATDTAGDAAEKAAMLIDGAAGHDESRQHGKGDNQRNTRRRYSHHCPSWVATERRVSRKTPT